jgi:hypothetical protein
MLLLKTLPQASSIGLTLETRIVDPSKYPTMLLDAIPNLFLMPVEIVSIAPTSTSI